MQEEIGPRHGLKSPACHGGECCFVAEDKRSNAWMSTRELGEPSKIGRRDLAGLHFDCPRAPTSLEDSVDCKRLLAPVAHVLSRVPGVGEARVLDPSAGSRIASRTYAVQRGTFSRNANAPGYPPMRTTRCAASWGRIAKTSATVAADQCVSVRRSNRPARVSRESAPSRNADEPVATIWIGILSRRKRSHSPLRRPAQSRSR